MKAFAAGEKLHGGFTLVPVKCHPGAAQPFRPFFKSYDDGGAKVSIKQASSSCEAALRAGFANPPSDVKIGCYYYWVNERVDTRILTDGTRIRFNEKSLFEISFPDGRTELWDPERM